MIVGITGTIGAGKGTVVDYLVSKKGFTHYSVREFLVEEIKKQGLPVDRDSMREVANHIRAEHEPSYIIATLFSRATKAGHDALIESVRAIGEAQFLKDCGAHILAVDADRKLRFERVTTRGSATDDVDFDTFVAHEEKELASTDPAGQNIIGVMQMADCRIENDGTLEELHKQVERVLEKLSN
jgi:dephospho-CoA kinase